MLKNYFGAGLLGKEFVLYELVSVGKKNNRG